MVRPHPPGQLGEPANAAPGSSPSGATAMRPSRCSPAAPATASQSAGASAGDAPPRPAPSSARPGRHAEPRPAFSAPWRAPRRAGPGRPSGRGLLAGHVAGLVGLELADEVHGKSREPVSAVAASSWEPPPGPCFPRCRAGRAARAGDVLGGEGLGHLERVTSSSARPDARQATAIRSRTFSSRRARSAARSSSGPAVIGGPRPRRRARRLLAAVGVELRLLPGAAGTQVTSTPSPRSCSTTPAAMSRAGVPFLTARLAGATAATSSRMVSGTSVAPRRPRADRRVEPTSQRSRIAATAAPTTPAADRAARRGPHRRHEPSVEARRTGELGDERGEGQPGGRRHDRVGGERSGRSSSTTAISRPCTWSRKTTASRRATRRGGACFRSRGRRRPRRVRPGRGRRTGRRSLPRRVGEGPLCRSRCPCQQTRIPPYAAPAVSPASGGPRTGANAGRQPPAARGPCAGTTMPSHRGRDGIGPGGWHAATSLQEVGHVKVVGVLKGTVRGGACEASAGWAGAGGCAGCAPPES